MSTPAADGSGSTGGTTETTTEVVTGSTTTRGTRDAREHGVRIVDTPAVRVHHPGDLLAMVLCALGVAVVCVLAVYAQGTTEGLAEDVQGFDSVLRRILFVPVAVLETVITFVAPVAVLVELFWRRLPRQAAEAFAAGVLGALGATLGAWLISRFGIVELRTAFSVVSGGERVVLVPPMLSATAALLTAAGSRNRRRTLPWSWNLLWIALGVAAVTNAVTLPGAIVTLLVGRMVGLAVRYASGVQSERAYGAALVDGVRRAGFDPASLVRVRDVSAEHVDGEAGLAADLASVALTRNADHRVYAMTTRDGRRLDVVALDGDRQVVGMLARFWRSLRLRGIEGRGVVSLRQAAERTALLSYAAAAAGVRTPRLLGIAEAEDSMLLIQEHATDAVPLRDLPDEDLTDAVLDAMWEQVRLAHAAGLAHRSLSSDVVLVDRTGAYAGGDGSDRPGGPVALLTGWEQGDVASSELARRMDVSQLLAALAMRVGAERAVASASRVLPDHDLARIGPLLQSIVLPPVTREEAREHKEVLGELREALLAKLPEAQAEPERLVRFGVRTVLTLVLAAAAVIVVLTFFNFADIERALRQAQPWWAAVAFACGLVTFLGSALAMVAFAPVRLPLWRTTLVQAAAAYVSLAAPAGIGPAALNLRLLQRRGVAVPVAVASVGLVQLSQLITTLAVLFVLYLFSGRDDLLALPSTAVVVALAVVAVAIGAVMLIPRVRGWVLARVGPVWRQTWPRLVQMLSRPSRFAVAVLGNLIMTFGYLGAFWASLAAFNLELSLIDLAIVYLLGNATGAAVPSPGGLGTVELTLIGLLWRTAGVATGLATSVVALFRGLTFWARIPVGWLAMRTLQRQGEL